MRRLHSQGRTWESIGRRYGTSGFHAHRLVAALDPPSPCPDVEGCPEDRPHSHCKACSVTMAPTIDPLCELCEREAFRALLVAWGFPREAERVSPNSDVLLRVLAWQASPKRVRRTQRWIRTRELAQELEAYGI